MYNGQNSNVWQVSIEGSDSDEIKDSEIMEENELSESLNNQFNSEEKKMSEDGDLSPTTPQKLIRGCTKNIDKIELEESHDEVQEESKDQENSSIESQSGSSLTDDEDEEDDNENEPEETICSVPSELSNGGTSENDASNNESSIDITPEESLTEKPSTHLSESKLEDAPSSDSQPNPSISYEENSSFIDQNSNVYHSMSSAT